MIVLRQGKARVLLESSIDSALMAVEIYNKPREKFRVENYIILMVLAWTKLFHAYFYSTIGDKYYYKKGKRYELVDGDRKAWELKKCLKEYLNMVTEVSLSSPAVKNLEFFIQLRNKIEHRHWDNSYLDIWLFGECQSLLYNYENFLISIFGEEMSLNTSLAYSLQFSHLRASQQISAQKSLLSKDMKNIKKYIEKYKSQLNQEILNSQEFSIKLILIPKVSNTKKGDLAIEFVNVNSLSDEQKRGLDRITTIIKDKKMFQTVSNMGLYKPSDVIKEVKKKTGVQLKDSDHVALWKSFQIRPKRGVNNPSNTNDVYCVFDEAHSDYLYTDKWVEFVCGLIVKYGYNSDNTYVKSKQLRNVKDFL